MLLSSTDRPSGDLAHRIAQASAREMWRVIALYEWAQRRGVALPQIEQARAELHLSDEDVAAELDVQERRVIEVPEERWRAP